MLVKAKRAGWDEVLTDEQLLDLDPYEHESDDLEGKLEVVHCNIPGMGVTKVYLVGGHEADPKTVEELT